VRFTENSQVKSFRRLASIPRAQRWPGMRCRADSGRLASPRPCLGLACPVDWISRWDNPDADSGESRTYLVVDEAAALVWAANFGALEWHAWTSRTDQPQLPTYALIDIDPGPATSWDDVLVLARLHRVALQHLDVAGQPKVTGQRGIQIWIPIARGPSFEEARSWTEQLSRAIGAAVPELVSWAWNVRQRGGLARLDYTQNVINKTLVAPYSPRGGRRPHLGPDRMGRARRSVPAARRVHHSRLPSPASSARRPLQEGSDHPADPAAHSLTHGHSSGPR
jgi:hypothetical protein